MLARQVSAVVEKTATAWRSLPSCSAMTADLRRFHWAPRRSLHRQATSGRAAATGRSSLLGGLTSGIMVRRLQGHTSVPLRIQALVHELRHPHRPIRLISRCRSPCGGGAGESHSSTSTIRRLGGRRSSLQGYRGVPPPRSKYATDNRAHRRSFSTATAPAYRIAAFLVGASSRDIRLRGFVCESKPSDGDNRREALGVERTRFPLAVPHVVAHTRGSRITVLHYKQPRARRRACDLVRGGGGEKKNPLVAQRRPGRRLTRISRPAWRAYTFSTPGFGAAASSSSDSRRLM